MASLKEKGFITEIEFEAKKKQLLDLGATDANQTMNGKMASDDRTVASLQSHDALSVGGDSRVEKDKPSKLVIYFGLFMGIILVLFGAMKVRDWSANNSDESAKQVALTLDEQKLMGKIKASPIMEGLEAMSPGTDVYNTVVFKYVTDQFREKSVCQIMFTGKKADDGQELPPKWGLYLNVGPKSIGNFYAESFFGPSKSVRLTLDQDPTVFELKSSGGDVTLEATQSLIEKASISKIAKLNHGFGATGEMSMLYDFSHFVSVLRIAQVLCLGVPIAPASSGSYSPVAAQPAVSGTKATAPVIQNEKMVLTRFGSIQISKENTLIRNGQTFFLNAEHNGQIFFSSGDGSPAELTFYRADAIGESDVLLLKLFSGNACPQLFYVVKVTSDNTDISKVFGTCSEVVEVNLSGEALSISMPDGPGETRKPFIYLNGRLTQDGVQL